jgi:hypothetical protein
VRFLTFFGVKKTAKKWPATAALLGFESLKKVAKNGCLHLETGIFLTIFDNF